MNKPNNPVVILPDDTHEFFWTRNTLPDDHCKGDFFIKDPIRWERGIIARLKTFVAGVERTYISDMIRIHGGDTVTVIDRNDHNPWCVIVLFPDGHEHSFHPYYLDVAPRLLLPPPILSLDDIQVAHDLIQELSK